MAWTDEGVKFVEFSPAAEIQPVLDHLGAQLARLLIGRRATGSRLARFPHRGR